MNVVENWVELWQDAVCTFIVIVLFLSIGFLIFIAFTTFRRSTTIRGTTTNTWLRGTSIAFTQHCLTPHAGFRVSSLQSSSSLLLLHVFQFLLKTSGISNLNFSKDLLHVSQHIIKSRDTDALCKFFSENKLGFTSILDCLWNFRIFLEIKNINFCHI